MLLRSDSSILPDSACERLLTFWTGFLVESRATFADRNCCQCLMFVFADLLIDRIVEGSLASWIVYLKFMYRVALTMKMAMPNAALRIRLQKVIVWIHTHLPCSMTYHKVVSLLSPLSHNREMLMIMIFPCVHILGSFFVHFDIWHLTAVLPVV